MKNKTPIQELFKMMDEHYAFRVSNAEDWLEKEKQFAFYCFMRGVDAMFESSSTTLEEKFEKFYSAYAE